MRRAYPRLTADVKRRLTAALNVAGGEPAALSERRRWRRPNKALGRKAAGTPSPLGAGLLPPNSAVGIMKMNLMIKMIIVLAMAALTVVGAGCANTGIKHVGPDEFIRESKTMEDCNSASGTFYLGASPSRVYVERTGLYRLIRFHDAMVYWTELDSLPKDIADVIRAGRCPWTPWEKKMKDANQQPEGIRR